MRWERSTADVEGEVLQMMRVKWEWSTADIKSEVGVVYSRHQE